MQTPSGGNNATQAPVGTGRRKSAMLAAAGVFAAIGIAWGAYWALHSRHLETTDDAYVAGNVVVTPRVDGTVVTIGADDTDVLQAAARVHEAYLALSLTHIPAAVGGPVAKRSVQVGQRVAPGPALMAIVPLDQVWVHANFKEGQLAQMRIGQPVPLEADIYGSRVEYHGKVAGLAAGTGSAFSLLPAQNATGNWIKVVQRVPVRIKLDADELKRYPLRVGLSMIAAVDVHDKHGVKLTASPRQSPAYETAVYGKLDAEADTLVRDIIEHNRGDVVTNNRTARATRHAKARVLAAAR